MIDLPALKEYGRLKGLSNIGHLEKDYLQDIFLLIIYRNFDAFIFKGGTCLYKVYKLDRFSEDLDFSTVKEFDIEHFLSTLKGGLEKFGISTIQITPKKAYNSFLTKWRIAGPLFTGTSQSLCTLRIDINTKSEVKKVISVTLSPMYVDIPSFDLLVMTKEEILAEKVRAIMSRTKARDLYDLWFLLKGDTEVNFFLIQEKLAYYEQKFSFNEFEKHLNLKKDIWKELTPLVQNLPSFSEVKKLILEKMKKGYREFPK